jgi:hypothetical protein
VELETRDRYISTLEENGTPGQRWPLEPRALQILRLQA